jgi:citrate synthase
LEDIGSKDRVPQYLELCKTKKKLLFGFGHRVYKNYDPRAAIVRRLAYQVFDIVGREPLIEIAEALEKAALADPWFVERKLYPNVDFYTGVIYKALGFPTDFFIPLFAIPRAAGWLAHWVESLDDTENHIARPRQIYTGPDERPYVPIEHRKPANVRSTACYVSAMSRRRDAGTDLGVPVAKSE